MDRIYYSDSSLLMKFNERAICFCCWEHALSKDRI